MEELDGIIAAISEHTDVPKRGILLGNTPQSATAHGYLCHIAVNCYPYLLNRLSSGSGRNTPALRLSAKSMGRLIETDKEVKLIMNRIRRALSLPTIKVRHKPGGTHISDTKRLFGFDYTDEEIAMRLNAIRSANRFMDKFCSLGRQPIDIGMVVTGAKPRRSYESWYNE